MNTTRKIKNTRLQRPCREVLLIDDGAGDVGDAPVGEIPQVGVQDSAAFDYLAAVGGPLDGIVWPFDGNNSIPPQKRLFYGHFV